MSQDAATGKRVLYIVVCAADPAKGIHEFIELAQGASWDVCVVATPQATSFIDRPLLERLTGRSVRSEYKQPDTSDMWPAFDAIVAVPATFNTINKFAYGIADTLAVSILCEGLGRGRTIVTVPCVNQNHLARHPIFTKSITMLRKYGVKVLYKPEMYPPRNEVPWPVILEELQRAWEQRK